MKESFESQIEPDPEAIRGLTLRSNTAQMRAERLRQQHQHLAGDDDTHSHGSRNSMGSFNSPTSHYWDSPQGKKVIKSLPPAAPPLDFRRLEWPAQQSPKGGGGGEFGPAVSGERGELVFADDYEYGEAPTLQLHGRMVSTAAAGLGGGADGGGGGGGGGGLAVGSALQAARRGNSNRAVTAPE
jgi:hypothetical protein